jgi:transcriptional regulator with XRE-family HTH domain
MKSVKFLEDVKKKFNLKNDAALARQLNVRPNTISQYMSGNRVMDEETCLAVALALDIDPLNVIMAAGIDRAERAGQHSLWEVFSMRTATQAASALLFAFVTLFLTPTPSEAAPVLKHDAGSLYIM